MWKPQIVRKSLIVKLREKLEEELCDQAKEITIREIEQEMQVIKAVKEVSDAWRSSMSGRFKEIPQLVWELYSQLPSFQEKPDEYILPLKNESDYMIRKEAVVLSLISHLYRPITAHQKENDWGIRTWFFVWLCQNHKRLATWSRTNKFLDEVRGFLDQSRQHELMKTVTCLKERLSGILDVEDMETKTILLETLALTLGVDASPKVIEKEIDKVFSDAILVDIPCLAKLAIERVEKILAGLPDPKKVSCEKAIRRIVEIYESIPKKDNYINAKTVEDATIIDHVDTCESECRYLDCCVETEYYRVCTDGYPDWRLGKFGKRSGIQERINSAKSNLLS